MQLVPEQGLTEVDDAPSHLHVNQRPNDDDADGYEYTITIILSTEITPPSHGNQHIAPNPSHISILTK